MKTPLPNEADELLSEASVKNPGLWVDHNKVAGYCAKTIARHAAMDEDAAYSLGLLHDVGRRFGVSDMRHIINGYNFMLGLGYTDSARICLTHSFPFKDIRAYNGENDCTPDESEFIKSFLEETQYDDYDRLIQLCDALAFPTGVCCVEKRLVDVTIRRGFNDFTIPKWKEYLSLETYFENKTGGNIYKLLNL